MSFEVLSQRQYPKASPAGGFEQVMEVTFKAHCGGVGRVDIPVAEYSRAKVLEVVTPLADEMCAIADIGK